MMREKSNKAPHFGLSFLGGLCIHRVGFLTSRIGDDGDGAILLLPFPTSLSELNFFNRVVVRYIAASLSEWKG